MKFLINQRTKFFVMILMCISRMSLGNTIDDGTSNGGVSNVTVTPYTSSILVIWNEVRGAKKYEVQYAEQNNMVNAEIITTTSRRIEIKDLNKETNYYINVRVFNNSKWSDWSAVKKGKTALFSTTVGTYNLLSSKYDHVYPNNIWKNRKKAVKAIIMESDNNPDIFGIQEGMVKQQVLELADLLKDSYECHISKRKVSPRAIFWKPERFELLSYGDDTEILDEKIAGFGTTRYATYVYLKEKNTGRNLLVFNLHAPSNYSKNRSKEREMLATMISNRAKVISKDSKNSPVIILGDFNSVPKAPSNDKFPSAPEVLARNGFTDTFSATSNRINAYYGTHNQITTGTATSGQNPANCSKRIDYIFTYSKNKITVSDYRIIINFAKKSGTVLQKPIPSDHRPVRATLHLHY